MTISKLITILLLLSLFPCRSAAQVPGPPPAGGSWVLIPFPIFSPETKAAMTLTSMWHRKAPGAGQASSVIASAAYSQLRQSSLRVAPELPFAGGRGWLTGDLCWADWPDYYYGIGGVTPESTKEGYTSRGHLASLAARYRLFSSFYAGVRAETSHYRLSGLTAGGQLASGQAPGGTGGTTAGAGLSAGWDSRDNRFFPRSGFFAELSGEVYSGALADFSFRRGRMDARGYLPAGRGTLALQGYASSVRGGAPFTELARLGDIREISLLRGYYSGRYRDRDLAVAQAEWRFPLRGRLGGSAFAGLGGIGRDFSSLHSYFGAGGGLRWTVNPEGINLRLDIAAGKDSGGIYFGLLEAF